MLSYILWAILIYFAYRFIVGFVIPVFKVTRQVRGQVKAFHEAARHQQQTYDQQSNNTSYSTSQQQQPSSSSAKTGDYIDFEEIK
ncbi:MAG: DUF4834 family protein [Chitinophagaceae bacterium]